MNFELKYIRGVKNFARVDDLKYFFRKIFIAIQSMENGTTQSERISVQHYKTMNKSSMNKSQENHFYCS